MLENLKIENAIIGSLELDFERINIFIGHNGSGKSRILHELGKMEECNYTNSWDDFAVTDALDYLYPIISEGKKIKPVYKEFDYPGSTELTEDDLNDPVVQNFLGEGANIKEKSMFPDYPGRHPQYQAAMEILIAIGADNILKNDAGEYIFVFHNGKMRKKIDEVSYGDLRLFALLFELYFGESRNQVWDEADALIFPCNLKQIAILLLMSDPKRQFFIATNTFLLNYILGFTRHGRFWHPCKIDYSKENAVLEIIEFWHNGRFYMESDEIHYDPFRIETAKRTSVVQIKKGKYIVLKSEGHQPYPKNQILEPKKFSHIPINDSFVEGFLKSNIPHNWLDDFVREHIEDEKAVNVFINENREKIDELQKSRAEAKAQILKWQNEIIESNVRTEQCSVPTPTFPMEMVEALTKEYYFVPDSIHFAEDINISVCYMSGSATYELDGQKFTNPASIRTHRLSAEEIEEMSKMAVPFDMERKFH